MTLKKVLPVPPSFNWATDWWIPVLAGIFAIVIERIIVTKWPTNALVKKFGGHL